MEQKWYISNNDLERTILTCDIDVHSKYMTQRPRDVVSHNMSRIRSEGTKLEESMKQILRRNHIEFIEQSRSLPGRPDFLLKKYPVAIFCDSEFWHGYHWETLKKQIKTNRSFWLRKIKGNMKRDFEVSVKLRSMGYVVLRFWGKEIYGDPNGCAYKIKHAIRGSKTMSAKSDVVAVDFFCGAGGMTEGLNKAGIRTILGIDTDPSVKDSYELNNPTSTFLNSDISKPNLKPISSVLGLFPKSKVVFAACAPCQPFSSANKLKGIDKRKDLLLEFAKHVERHKPHAIIMENVPGMLSKGEPILDNFIETLAKNGYQVQHRGKIMDAKDFGVPQTRRRLILLAAKGKKVEYPTPTHGPNRGRKYRTVQQAIGHLPSLAAGETHNSIPNHVARNLSKVNQDRLSSIPMDGGSRTSWPQNLWLECHKRHGGHKDVYGRMKWDDPSPTLTCRCNSISNGRFGHPQQNRAISLREAACLQSFDSDYIFYGMSDPIAAQIGNAIPPKLSRKLGIEIVKAVVGERSRSAANVRWRRKNSSKSAGR